MPFFFPECRLLPEEMLLQCKVEKGHVSCALKEKSMWMWCSSCVLLSVEDGNSDSNLDGWKREK